MNNEIDFNKYETSICGIVNRKRLGKYKEEYHIEIVNFLHVIKDIESYHNEFTMHMDIHYNKGMQQIIESEFKIPEQWIKGSEQGLKYLQAVKEEGLFEVKCKERKWLIEERAKLKKKLKKNEDRLLRTASFVSITKILME